MFNIDPLHLKLDQSPSKMVQDVWASKYKWKTESDWSATALRVAAAIYSNDEERHLLEAQEAMELRLWIPGGRILAGAGTEKRVTMMNCLSGDTEFFTKEYGIKPLVDLSGKTVTVLTKDGWKSADIRCFGFQKLNTITLAPSRSKLRRKSVRATSDHRWILSDGSETTKLQIGMSLASCSAFAEGNREDYRDGLFHGIIFGDGQLHRQTMREVSGGHPLGTYHHVLRACGRVTEHYELLDEYCTNYKQPEAAKGDRIYYHHGSENLKDLPLNKTADYMQGFIDGWWIADGHYENGETQRCISSTNYAHLDWLIKNAPLGGYIVTGDKIIGKKVTNLGVAKDPCRAVTIRHEHDISGWQVVDIQEDEVEPVYCAVVPEVHAFCLTEGLYTGNCYVNERLDDSMEGIMHGLTNTALTLQQGGGIGTDFSTLRPEGALLTRTHTKASGPLPFMHMWDRASATIRSAGDRRGAMMGTMCDTHPDILKFIHAKREANALTQFNMSVLVSDALMEAVKEDAEWLLYFHVPPVERPEGLSDYDFIDEGGIKQYVYAVLPARELWTFITRNTYEYSEPGVIFIDRVNDLNNLYYCEDIRCTNPCGEQPLPPHGTCNLGHINLARCVRNPFSSSAELDNELIRQITRMGVRFLDNVIDITRYPLDSQALEEQNKRRLGLGFTGLADCLAQLGVRYGSPDAVRVTEEINRIMCWEAYKTSAELAAERGPFPLFNKDAYLLGNNFAATMLPKEIKTLIAENGIRNSLLMTVAPTGTGSIVVGNVSSGCEPVFLHSTERRVLKPTSGFKDEWDTYVEWGYGARLYHMANDAPIGSLELPSYMVTTEDLTIQDHVVMQAAAQRWIDASISKTINVPKEMTYDEFVKVYDLAYSLGCKGCTTYRPSDVRGSVLSKPGESKSVISAETLAERPEELSGITYKIKWPSMSSSLYLTINSDAEGNPFECFLASKDSKFHDWTTALTVMITAIFRKGGDVSFVAKELQQIQSLSDGAFKDGRHHPSLAAYVGHVLEQHITKHKSLSTHAKSQPFQLIIPGELIANGTITSKKTVTAIKGDLAQGERCPNCSQLTYVRKEGCKVCTNCDFTTCG